jgi:hypothetical protein
VTHEEIRILHFLGSPEMQTPHFREQFMTTPARRRWREYQEHLRELANIELSTSGALIRELTRRGYRVTPAELELKEENV